MQGRIEIFTKSSIRDTEGEKLSSKIKNELNIDLKCHFIECYNFSDEINKNELEEIAKIVFLDKIATDFAVKEPAFASLIRIEVGMLPGVTDNIGKTATEAIEDKTGKKRQVYYSRIYAVESANGKISDMHLEQIAQMIHNPLIEKATIYRNTESIEPYLPVVKIQKTPSVEKIDLNIPKAKLELFAKERLLAISTEELSAIKDYFKDPKTIKERKEVGLDEKITDVELEALAQTWSEHCKHKIFNAQIVYEENGEQHAINSLFKTFIKAATEQVKKPYIVSVFKDNGGIIKFNHKYDVAIKVETHNSPSALDPYGGALTGVLGVQRDIVGTGIGANPIANLDILCFGPQDAKQKELPKGVLHPKKIFDGVVKGVEHGGNKMGIPTVNGSIVFEDGYLTRPLVYCGTIGIMPSEIKGLRSSEKIIKPGYLAVMVGGRIGKDGIHGATFSSMQLDSSVPQSVVQIGDPITQKKMFDMILEARDKRLYDAITDNGAGGISSSLGEMAQMSGGVEIYLDKCPLKYPGLDPWEILVSESQERMSIAVPQENIDKIMEIARKHDVEATVVGKFTDSGKFHIIHNLETVGYLDMEFLHDGNPQLKLKANWKRFAFPEPTVPYYEAVEVLHKLLQSPNITTKERVVRSFDHEVKGMSVIKPIMSGPCDAAVIRPAYDSQEGLVIAHGICPRYVQDAYHMSAVAFDEAVRNAVAVGAKFGYLAALDNFSWPDPIKSDKTPDGEYKLGALVRSCLAIYDIATVYGIPIISGKDSMKNDFYTPERKYSIPPTLLMSVMGKIDSVSKAVTMDFKKAGSNIYVLGKTRNELGGSEFYKLFKGVGDKPPQVYPEETVPLYKAVTAAIEEGIIESAHDISEGGIAVALAECALANGVGCEIDLGVIQKDTDERSALLFSESAGRFIVSVAPENCERFEEILNSVNFAKCGRVRGDKRFVIKQNEEIVVNEAVEKLKESFERGV